MLDASTELRARRLSFARLDRAPFVVTRRGGRAALHEPTAFCRSVDRGPAALHIDALEIVNCLHDGPELTGEVSDHFDTEPLGVPWPRWPKLVCWPNRTIPVAGKHRRSVFLWTPGAVGL